jgi:hypothetical protein
MKSSSIIDKKNLDLYSVVSKIDPELADQIATVVYEATIKNTLNILLGDLSCVTPTKEKLRQLIEPKLQNPRLREYYFSLPDTVLRNALLDFMIDKKKEYIAN